MSKNRVTTETVLTQEQTDRLIERLVGNFHAKKLRPQRQMWGVKFLPSQRADGRVRVGSAGKCCCGLGAEMCGAFVKKTPTRGWTDYAAIRLRRAGFPVTKAFCDGFVEGFDYGDGSSGFCSTQFSQGQRIGAAVALRTAAL